MNARIGVGKPGWSLSIESHLLFTGNERVMVLLRDADRAGCHLYEPITPSCHTVLDAVASSRGRAAGAVRMSEVRACVGSGSIDPSIRAMTPPVVCTNHPSLLHILKKGGGAWHGGREGGGEEVLRVGLPDQAPAHAVSGWIQWVWVRAWAVHG